MATRSPQDGQVAAASLVGAFTATLFVLLAAAANGTRPWIMLMRAAGAFLLVWGILRLVIAGIILAMQRTDEPAPISPISLEENLDHRSVFTSSIRSKELKPKGVS